MSEISVTGTIQEVTWPALESTRPIKVKVAKDSGGTRTVTVWRTIRDSDGSTVTNPVAEAVGQGLRGTFQGYEKPGTLPDGKTFVSFVATDFELLPESPAKEHLNGNSNGSGSEVVTSSQGGLSTYGNSSTSSTARGGLLSPRERAVECAKDNINHLIEVGVLKEIEKIPAYIHELTQHYAAALEGQQ